MMKVLPMGEPIIDCYPGYGGPYSILGAHTKEHIPWIYNYFVQLYAPASFSEGNRLSYSPPDVTRASPWLKTICIDRYLALDIGNIIDIIKTFINYDYYFYARFVVSQVAAYQRNNFFEHEMFIYGYNDEKEEFYFSDNYKNGTYAHGGATYQEIEAATRDYTPGKNDSFSGFKYIAKNELKEFQFDKRAYIDFMIDYIEEKNNARYWNIPGLNMKVHEGRRWGIGVYSYVQDYLNLFQKMDKYLDNRGFYVIKDHKLTLEKSLTYVLGDQWKRKYPLAWQMLEKDIQMATIALNLCLKYNITCDGKTLDKIRYYVAELEANDRILFPCLIDILEKN